MCPGAEHLSLKRIKNLEENDREHLLTGYLFMNEIANICEKVGADVNNVRVGIGSDKRIGYSFIYPGCGYGGSCFPKDVQALIRSANQVGYQAKVLESVEAVNYTQKEKLFE